MTHQHGNKAARTGLHRRDMNTSEWSNMWKLLIPGVGLKRWMAVGALGVGICAIGLAFLLKNLLALTFPDFLPLYLEGVLIGGVGIAVIAVAVLELYKSVGPAILGSDTIPAIADTIYTRRSRERGPRIVTIGGGTGLGVLLRGLKAYTNNMTAIVTVADDGGSSGRLREELGVPPPGDFRNCLVAMSDEESLVADLFQYRFGKGNGLEGHSFGNLFIVAMAEVTGSFELGLQESSRVLAVRGQALPATASNLKLRARLTDGSIVLGESSITERGGQIERLYIEPEDAIAYSGAVDAIRDAQMIVMGPGSLYTSILPNLLVPGITDAVKESTAIKVYVCNVATQKGETDSYTVFDHLRVLQDHTNSRIADCVVANDAPVDLGDRFLGTQVVHDGRSLGPVGLVEADLQQPDHPVRHDSEKLARVLVDIFEGKREPTISATGGPRTN